MEYMFVPGFLGTRAPFYMDFVTLIVALLPSLVALGVFIVRRGFVKTHIVFQLFLFLFSIVIIGYFEYGVRLDGGFEKFAKQSSIPEGFLTAFLLFHIIVSLLMLVWWVKTIVTGMRDYFGGRLPGTASYRHFQSGRLTIVGIALSAFTGIWVYLFLFVF